MTATPVFDLIAVAYRTPMETLEFLDSFRKLNGEVPYTLTVVDNDPEGSDVLHVLSAYTRKNFPNCSEYTVVKSSRNNGYARTCNDHGSEGSAPYIGLLNTDMAFTDPDILGEMADTLDWPDVGICGPRQTNAFGQLVGAGMVNQDGQIRQRTWLTKDGPEYQGITEVDAVSGSAFFLRRETWNDLTSCLQFQNVASARDQPPVKGPLLPTEHYFEETYCCVHAKHHGWRVVFRGDVHMTHYFHRSSEEDSREDELRFRRSGTYFTRALRHHSINLNELSRHPA